MIQKQYTNPNNNELVDKELKSKPDISDLLDELEQEITESEDLQKKLNQIYYDPCTC